VRYFGVIVMYSSCFCILFGCSTLCWTMIQSCDYDWISIFHVMDCMYSVWGSLELTSKCQKTSSSDPTGVAPNGLGYAAWQLRVCCQVIKENQRNLERMAPGGKCYPVKRKRSGRGSGKCVAPGGEKCPTRR